MEEYEKLWPSPNLGHCLGIWWRDCEKPRLTCQDGWSLSRYLKPGPPDHEFSYLLYRQNSAPTLFLALLFRGYDTGYLKNCWTYSGLKTRDWFTAILNCRNNVILEVIFLCVSLRVNRHHLFRGQRTEPYWCMHIRQHRPFCYNCSHVYLMILFYSPVWFIFSAL
jgi:hypothetical protein